MFRTIAGALAVTLAAFALTACSGRLVTEHKPVVVLGQGSHWAQRAGCAAGSLVGGDGRNAQVRVTRVHGRPQVADAVIEPGSTIAVPRERLRPAAEPASDQETLCALEGGVVELIETVVRKRFDQSAADRAWQLRVKAMVLKQDHLLMALDLIEATGRAAANDSWEQAARFYMDLEAELSLEANRELSALVYEHLSAPSNGSAGSAGDETARIVRAAARGGNDTAALAALIAELARWYSMVRWDAVATNGASIDRFDAIVTFGGVLADFLTRKGSVRWNGKTDAELRDDFRRTLVARLVRDLRRDILAKYGSLPIRSEWQANRAFAAARQEVEPYRVKLGTDILTAEDRKFFSAQARRGYDDLSRGYWTELERKVQLALLEGMLRARVTLPGKTESMFGATRFHITFDSYVPASGDFDGRIAWADHGETRIKGKVLREALALEFADVPTTARGGLDLGEGSTYRFSFSTDMKRLVGRRSHPRAQDSWFDAQISVKTGAAE